MNRTQKYLASIAAAATATAVASVLTGYLIVYTILTRTHLTLGAKVSTDLSYRWHLEERSRLVCHWVQAGKTGHCMMIPPTYHERVRD